MDNDLRTHILIGVICTAVLFFLVDLTFHQHETEYKKTVSVELTPEVTEDSTSIKHIVLRNSDGTLSTLNNVEQDIAVDDRVAVIHLTGGITGLKYKSVFHALKNW